MHFPACPPVSSGKAGAHRKPYVLCADRMSLPVGMQTHSAWITRRLPTPALRVYVKPPDFLKIGNQFKFSENTVQTQHELSEAKASPGPWALQTRSDSFTLGSLLRQCQHLTTRWGSRVIHTHFSSSGALFQGARKASLPLLPCTHTHTCTPTGPGSNTRGAALGPGTPQPCLSADLPPRWDPEATGSANVERASQPAGVRGPSDKHQHNCPGSLSSPVGCGGCPPLYDDGEESSL